MRLFFFVPLSMGFIRNALVALGATATLLIILGTAIDSGGYAFAILVGFGVVGFVAWIGYEITSRSPPPLGITDRTGRAFEDRCAEALRNQGWTARLTPISGDQGVDILATKAGRTLAIQCKSGRSMVGNAAVQEVFAGKVYVGADYAAVVTSGGYTQSACNLAAATGVHLLTWRDLPHLNRML